MVANQAPSGGGPRNGPFHEESSISRSTRHVIYAILILLAFLALLNPGYSSASVEGPTGIVKSERFTFGPGSLLVYTRVTADENTVQIEHR